MSDPAFITKLGQSLYLDSDGVLQRIGSIRLIPKIKARFKSGYHSDTVLTGSSIVTWRAGFWRTAFCGHSPNERWKASLIALPIIKPISTLAYNVFARLLYRWNIRKGHWKIL